MTTFEKIEKRIKTMQRFTHGKTKEILITKKEAKELGSIDMIDGVMLIIAKEKEDCFAYKKDMKRYPCYALNELLCKNGICPFYKKENEKINIIEIEKDIIKNETYGSIKGVSLR